MINQRSNRVTVACAMMLSALASCAFAGASFAVAAPSSPPSGVGLRTAEPVDADRAKMLGVLTFTPMSVSLDEVPAREAFAAVAEALGVSILGRWSDDKTGQGLDPSIRVTMHIERAPARKVIEELLEQCEEYEDCTWQLRMGMIEIGTKARLAVPAARERLRYDLTDLLLDPPYFPSRPQRFTPMNSPYIESVLGQESREALRNGDPPPRKTKPMLVRELVEGLSETIEPGHWDVEAIMNETDAPAPPDDDQSPFTTAASPTTTGGGKAAKSPPQRNTSAWATAGVFRDSLFITAPDFMHRQIGGYPQPIKPVDVETVRLVTVASANDSPAATAKDAATEPRATPAEPVRKP